MIFGFKVIFFFVKQKTAYEMRISDWSSDVCSSDLLFVEGDAFQLLRVVFQLRLAVLFPEEAGVGQAGGEHLAIARDDGRAAVLRLYIGGADEGGGELDRRIAQDDIFQIGRASGRERRGQYV